jgi:hypothetical protein
MPRNPNWSDEAAEDFRGLISEDDGPSEPLAIDNPSDVLDLVGQTGGSLDADDPIDFVEVELDRNGLYTVLATGSPPGEPGTALPLDLSIFDEEGYLLQFVDAEQLFVEQPGTDTIFQFRPDESGTYYLAVSFLFGQDEEPPTGAWALQAAVDFGEVDEETGNTSPLARDALLTTRSFETEALVPLGADFDADGDALSLAAVTQQPQSGVAALVDGEILYRADRGFAGLDSFEYEISDGNGGTDTGRVVVEVLENEEGVSVAEAQRIAYLYEAGLDRDGDIDSEGLNFWIDEFEDDTPILEISEAFLVSDEFTEAFGAIDDLDDDTYVSRLYDNVLDRESDPDGFDFWVEQLDTEALSRAEVLIAFADSAENFAGSPEIADLAQTEDGDWAFA